MVLCWTLSSMSMSFVFWGDWNWTQDTGGSQPLTCCLMQSQIQLPLFAERIESCSISFNSPGKCSSSRCRTLLCSLLNIMKYILAHLSSLLKSLLIRLLKVPSASSSSSLMKMLDRSRVSINCQGTPLVSSCCWSPTQLHTSDHPTSSGSGHSAVFSLPHYLLTEPIIHHPLYEDLMQS